AVARGLRLARGDADLLADQGVEQRGLAHVGLADDGHEAATLCRLRGLRIVLVLAWGLDRGVHFSFIFSTMSIAAAAACSPARRDAPMPRSTRPSSVTSHSTSKVCLCAAPSVPTTR